MNLKKIQLPIILAAGSATDWIGQISPPVGNADYTDKSKGLDNFINNGFKLIFMAFGVYALINFVLSAYDFINSQGEAKKIEQATKRLTQTIIALVLLVMVFIFAGLIGAIFFGDWNYLLNFSQTLSTITTK